MGRNAVQIPISRFQIPMVKWLFKLRLGPGLVSISPLKVAFVKKRNKKFGNKLLTNTPLIFLNLENRNILIVLHTKIPKLNDKRNIDIVIDILNIDVDITPKAVQYR